MPVVRITHKYSVAGGSCQNIYHYFHPTQLPNSTHVSQLLDRFAALVLPYILDLMTDAVLTEELAGYAYNLGFSQTLGNTDPGTIVAGSAGTVANDMGLIMRRNLGDTILNDGGAAYTGNRPIRRSHILLGGMPKAIMSGTGYNSSGFPTGVLAAFNAAMLATLPTTITGSQTWYHNVLGLHLDALPPSASFPTGKPERPVVVAPVLSVAGAGWGDLKTRES